jgi:hypothetical protein
MILAEGRVSHWTTGWESNLGLTWQQVGAPLLSYPTHLATPHLLLILLSTVQPEKRAVERCNVKPSIFLGSKHFFSFSIRYQKNAVTNQKIASFPNFWNECQYLVRINLKLTKLLSFKVEFLGRVLRFRFDTELFLNWTRRSVPFDMQKNLYVFFSISRILKQNELVRFDNEFVGTNNNSFVTFRSEASISKCLYSLPGRVESVTSQDSRLVTGTTK